MTCARPPRLYATGGNAAISTDWVSPSTARARQWSWGWPTSPCSPGNLGRRGVGVNPLRGQNNVRARATWAVFPHELPGYRHVSRPAVRAIYESLWGCGSTRRRVCGSPICSTPALGGSFLGLYVQGEDIAHPIPTRSIVQAALRSMELVVVQDLFLNETAQFAPSSCRGPASSGRMGRSPTPSAGSARSRPVMPSVVGRDEWQVVCDIATAMGYPMSYADPPRSWTRSPRRHHFRRGFVRAASTPRIDAVAGHRRRPHGTPTMRPARSSAGSAADPTVYVDHRAGQPPVPAHLTTGRILTQYNVGAQTRRTAKQPRGTGHPRITRRTPSCAASRVAMSSPCRARSGHDPDRAHSPTAYSPVSSTTFHHPVTGANVVTTENSDWATNCPEYKVTAVR